MSTENGLGNAYRISWLTKRAEILPLRMVLYHCAVYLELFPHYITAYPKFKDVDFGFPPGEKEIQDLLATIRDDFQNAFTKRQSDDEAYYTVSESFYQSKGPLTHQMMNSVTNFDVGKYCSFSGKVFRVDHFKNKTFLISKAQELEMMPSIKHIKFSGIESFILLDDWANGIWSLIHDIHAINSINNPIINSKEFEKFIHALEIATRNLLYLSGLLIGYWRAKMEVRLRNYKSASTKTEIKEQKVKIIKRLIEKFGPNFDRQELITEGMKETGVYSSRTIKNYLKEIEKTHPK